MDEDLSRDRGDSSHDLLFQFKTEETRLPLAKLYSITLRFFTEMLQSSAG